MIGIIIIVGIVFIVGLLLVFACCKAAGDYDRKSEKQYLEYIKSKTKENNNTNNEGE